MESISSPDLAKASAGWLIFQWVILFCSTVYLPKAKRFGRLYVSTCMKPLKTLHILL